MTLAPSIVPPISRKRKPLTFRTPDFGALAARLGLPYLHQRADGSWAVPSGTRAGVEYTVWLGTSTPTCECEGFAYRGRCTHILLAQAKAQEQSPPPPVMAAVLYCEAQDAYLLPDDFAEAEAERAAIAARAKQAVEDLFGSEAA